MLEQTRSRNRKCRMTTTGSSKCSAIKFFSEMLSSQYAPMVAVIPLLKYLAPSKRFFTFAIKEFFQSSEQKKRFMLDEMTRD